MIIAINGLIGHGKDTLAKVFQYVRYCDTFQPTKYQQQPMGLINWLDDTIQPNIRKLFREEKSGWETMKFADKLKDITCLLLGCTREQLEDQDFKKSVLPEQWNRTEKDAINYFTTKVNKNAFTSEQAVRIAIEHGFKYERTVREFLQELGTDVLRNWIGDVHVNATFNNYVPMRKRLTNATPYSELQNNIPQLPNWLITDMRFPNEFDAVVERGGIPVKITDPRKEVPQNLHESEKALRDRKFSWYFINDSTFYNLHAQVKEFTEHFKL